MILSVAAGCPACGRSDGILARAGLIRYTRGKIQVLDRARLEEASCECYGIIQREYERLVEKGGA